MMADEVLTINGYNRREGHLEPEFMMGNDFLGVDFLGGHYVSRFTDIKFPAHINVYELIIYDENDGEVVLALVENEGLVSKLYPLMKEKFLQEREED